MGASVTAVARASERRGGPCCCRPGRPYASSDPSTNANAGEPTWTNSKPKQTGKSLAADLG